MAGRSQLFFSNKMTHYFMEWTTPSGLLKNVYYYLCKKFDISNRSSLLLKTTVPQKKIKAKLNIQKKQLSGESSFSESHTCKSKCL